MVTPCTLFVLSLAMSALLSYLSLLSHTPLRPLHPLLHIITPSIRPWFIPIFKLISLHSDSPTLLSLLILFDPYLLPLLPISASPILTLFTLPPLLFYTYSVAPQQTLHFYTAELDLTPNPGLWWYMITEMFVQWRAFFVGVLVLNMAIYSLPIQVRLR
jgi:hypothetical protein